MSSPYNVGPPAPFVYNVGGNAFDPAALSRRIDQQVAAIAPGQNGRLLIDLTKDRQSIGLLWKVGTAIDVLGTVNRTSAGIDGELSIGVNFAFAAPKPAPKAWTRGEVYSLLRERGNGIIRSSIKMHAVHEGVTVELDG